MKLSVIIPCKNEEGNILGLYNKLSETLKKIKYELIFIDDGSTDKTLDNLRKIYEHDMLHVKILSFSRNFKKEAAMLAGLEHSTGEYTCIIDGDMQQNPGYLNVMYDFLENNDDYDEVAMVMKQHKEISKFKAFCTNTFYNIIDKISEVHFERSASDFRMFRGNVKNAMIELVEKNRFTKGIFSWVGFKVKYLEYEVEPRRNGESSFNFKASVAYAINGIIAFSSKPLALVNVLGTLSLLSFFIYLIVFIVQLVAFDLVFSPIYILILLVLLMSGLQFIGLGIMGSYIARIYNEVKGRPVYILKEKIGFSDKNIL